MIAIKCCRTLIVLSLGIRQLERPRLILAWRNRSRISEQQKNPSTTSSVEAVQEEVITETRTDFVESGVGLGCVKDVKNLIVALCKQTLSRKAINPFPDDTPKRLLERQFTIMTFNVSSSWTGVGASFPLALFSVPSLVCALETFQYFRGELDISVKINSTPYHAGMLMITFEHDLPSTIPDWNTKQLSVFNPILLNYSSSDQATIQVGWMKPEFFLRTGSGGTTPDSASAIGFLRITPIISLTNPSTVISTIQVSVLANFRNTQVAGFVASQSGRSAGKFKSLEQEDKSENSMTVSAKSPEKTTSTLEAVEAGVSIATLLVSLAAMLDKPRNLAASSPMFMDSARHLPNVDGLDQSQRFSMYQKSILAHTAVSENCETSDMSFVAMAQIPMLYALVGLTNSSPSYTITVSPNATTGFDSTTPDFFQYTAAAFQWWKGSVKYLLIFVTDSFTTCKVRVSYSMNTVGSTDYGGEYPNMILDVKGTTYVDFSVPYLNNLPYRTYADTNCPQVIIELLTDLNDVSSTTLNLVIWRAAGDDIQFHQMCTSALSVATATTTSTTTTGITTSRDTLQSQCDVRGQFKKKFRELGCDSPVTIEAGYVTSEIPLMVSDALKRYNVQFDDGYFPTLAPTLTTNGFWQLPLYYWTLVFKYFRGSRRYFVSETTTPIFRAFHIGFPTTSNLGAGTIIKGPLQDSITMEIPHMGMHPYYPMDYTISSCSYDDSEIPTLIPGTTPGTSITYVACGDDVQLFYLLPPPDLAFPSRGRLPVNRYSKDKKKEVQPIVEQPSVMNKRKK